MYNFTFFDKNLAQRRFLKGYSGICKNLLQAKVIGSMIQGVEPVGEIMDEKVDEMMIILCQSYARKPGKGLERLQNKLGTPLPDDFLQFYRENEEAVVVTRTQPIHLWNEDEILAYMRLYRDADTLPGRFFRFGEYWPGGVGYWFGLWQEDVVANRWKVVIASDDERDEHLDSDPGGEYKYSGTFYEWLKDLISRDGVPDHLVDSEYDGYTFTVP